MPYKSLQQERYFNAVLKKHDPAMVAHWNTASAGMPLPNTAKIAAPHANALTGSTLRMRQPDRLRTVRVGKL